MRPLSTRFDLRIDGLPLARAAGLDVSFQPSAEGSVRPGHCALYCFSLMWTELGFERRWLSAMIEDDRFI